MIAAGYPLQHRRYEPSPARPVGCGLGRLWLSVLVGGLGWLGPVLVLAAEPAAAGAGNQAASARPASIPLELEQPAEPVGPADRQDGATGLSELPFDWQAWAVVLLAIAGILGLRFVGRQKTQPLPADVFELLGESTLVGQPVRIVRFGPKTLLVTTGSGGPRTLAELDDPLATEWIAAACRGDRTLRAVRTPAGPARKPAGSHPSGPAVEPFSPDAQQRSPHLPPAEVA